MSRADVQGTLQAWAGGLSKNYLALDVLTNKVYTDLDCLQALAVDNL